jgi:hypothetical protein
LKETTPPGAVGNPEGVANEWPGTRERTQQKGGSVKFRRIEIAQEYLGEIDGEGFCACPGREFHTSRTGARDCRFFPGDDGRPPALACFHTSCSSARADRIRVIRSAIAREESGATILRAPIARPMTERDRAASARRSLAQRASAALPVVCRDYLRTEADWFHASPWDLPQDPNLEQAAILRLFPANDVVWMGEKHHSGEGWAGAFREAGKWLQSAPPWGPLTSPCAFRSGTTSRAKDEVIARRFLVVEGDTLSLDEQGAILAWLQHKILLRLRAIVFSGNRSLHGWFDVPSPEVLAELEVILPAMGCDPAMFRASQPARMPCWRNPKSGNLSRLWYLDGGCV